MRKDVVTKEFKITATPYMMKKFERFLCFFHYNGGHSGLFGMEFDGDGDDFMKVNPPPDENLCKGMEDVSGSSEIEIARNDGFGSLKTEPAKENESNEDRTLFDILLETTNALGQNCPPPGKGVTSGPVGVTPKSGNGKAPRFIISSWTDHENRLVVFNIYNGKEYVFSDVPPNVYNKIKWCVRVKAYGRGWSLLKTLKVSEKREIK